MSEVQVFYEATPNPDSMKFVITQDICNETIHFTEPTAALRSPLASKIFGFPWTAGVMLGANFVTVTKQDWVDWDILAEPLSHLIQEHILQNEAILLEPEQYTPSEDDIQEGDSEAIVKIKTILKKEIRPAVALDGGDIVFEKYENNIVYVKMKGACNGCPSASQTLKQGVEMRLRQALPEIEEVVSV